MSEDKPNKNRWLNGIDNILVTLCVTILIILCAGDPDLLDAIIERVRNGKG